MAPRKTTRQSWSEEGMARAIRSVSSGRYSYLKAAKVFSVPKSTLERRVKNLNKNITGDEKGLGSRQRPFSRPMGQESDDSFSSDDDKPLANILKDCVSPEMIQPYPKAPLRRPVKTANRGKAAILTSTPYKDEQFRGETT